MAVSKSLRYQVLRRDNHTCRYCGRSAPEVRLTVDHVVPEALGGSDKPENLAAACSDCNSGKSATPPDAAQVAQVQDDAIRWSAAVRAAAAEMVADLERRDRLRTQFRQAWERWKIDEQPLPLPGNWRDTVDTFVTAGLPMPVLLECVDIAMGRDKVKIDVKFRYMCGIAWKRVTALQNAAQAHVTAPADTTTVSSGNGDEVLGEMFGSFPWCDQPEEVSALVAEFDEWDDEESGRSHWSDFEKAFAQSVSRVTNRLDDISSCLWFALGRLAPAAKERLLDRARREFEVHEVEPEYEEQLVLSALIDAMEEHPEARRD